MDNKWYQVYCKAPDGNGYSDARAAKRIDGHLVSSFAAAFVSPDGIPLKNDQGEYEVRVFVGSQLNFVKRTLTDHYGLVITRVVENE